MSKEDLISAIPFVGKVLLEKEKSKNIQNTDENINNSSKKILGKKSDKTVESELPFEDVVNNIIKIESGKYRTIVRTNAINLNDMDKEDRDITINMYADYISGLTKAHQVYVPSFSLDIREQIQRLEDRYDEEEENVQQWIVDDIEHQKDLKEENDTIETQFYIVYQADFKPSKDESKDYLKAKKILYKMVKFASDELEGIGLYIKHLNKKQIGTLYYYFFNPFSAGIQEPNFDDFLVTGIESKGQNFKINKKSDGVEEDITGETFELNKENTSYLEQGALSYKNKISPYSINDQISGDYIKIGSTYMTVYEIYDYPTNLPPLWTKKLFNYRENIDVSMHVKPIPTSDVVKELDKAAVNYGSSMVDLRTGQRKKATTSIEKKMESTSKDVDKIIDELDSGNQSFYHFSMYVLVKERSLEELEETCLELENVIGSMRVLFRKCSENMKNAVFSILPIGVDYLGTTRNMLTNGIANAFPFTNFTFSHKDGFFLGTHKYNQSFVYFNPFNLDNANGAIMGGSGGGKSTTVKKIAKGFVTTMNIPIRVIDPEGENIKFAEEIGAEVIDYFVGSDHRINVLDPEPDDEVKSLLKPTINFVKLFLNKIMKISDEDRTKIDYSLIELYKKFGFTDDKESYWDPNRKEEGKFIFGKLRRKPPELINLYELWKGNELVDKIGDTTGLADKLREFTRLGTNDMFDGETNVNFNNKRIYFNLKHLDKVMKEPAVFVLFHKLWDLARKNPLEEKAIITEEVHILLRDDEIGEYVYDINKRIRKYGGSSIYITQNITDFMKTKWGPEILKNCSWAVLVKQNKRDVEILQDTYEMTKSEALKMTKFNRDKGEAYLIADKFRIPINVVLSEKEKRTFTTKTSELRKYAEESRNNDNSEAV